ncbi:helix-turn-helix transcriptional regulator [candidate division KSB1 bacterium]|nr:helix-turn-helix transcriptional regulator [candidate division KSB1 bacterium]
MNIQLKFKIYEKYRTQSDAAKVFGMREDRLSQIIRGRRSPTDQEKYLIAQKLQADTEALFAEG